MSLHPVVLTLRPPEGERKNKSASAPGEAEMEPAAGSPSLPGTVSAAWR